MKKMLWAIILSICSTFTIFAGDADDIKNTILQSPKCAAEEKWDQALSCYAEDFKMIASDGTIISLEQLKEIMMIIDEDHPYEFLIFAHKMENKGKEPSSTEKQQLKKNSQDANFQVKYKQICKNLAKEAKESALLELKTIKFRDIKVDDMIAVATYDSDSTNDSGEIVSEVTVCKLRKINGDWKIYESAIRKK